MSPYLIDTHSHIHFPPYSNDIADVLKRMQEKNIWTITIGTALENSQEAIAFAERNKGVWATVGLHPSHTTSQHLDEQEGKVDEHEFDGERAEALAKSSQKVVAIGECGLDFYRLDPTEAGEQAQKTQEQEFLKQLALCQKLDLPVVIHCRDGLTRLAEIIQNCWNNGWKPRGVVHSFTGTWTEAKPLIDLGLMIAVNGIATFPLRKNQDPATAIDLTIKNIPLESLLLETDAPYLAPNPHRGKRNEPCFVEYVAQHVADIRATSLAQIAEKTTQNALSVFNLKQ